MARRHETTRVFNNKHGYRGVEWNREKQAFKARIESTPGKRGRWLGYFATAEQAALAYDEAARIDYGPDAYLNFPMPGEKQAVQSPRAEGRCANGHDLSEHGYKHARGINCRRCNAEARKRSYRRNGLKPEPASRNSKE